jgi:hypothetical protein
MTKPNELPSPPETKQEEPKIGLPDPHENSIYKPSVQLFARVFLDDINTIQSVSPGISTKQRLIASYVKSLADELRSKGINYYSPENLARFTAIIERRNSFVLDSDTERPTIVRDAGSNGGTDDSGAKERVRKGAANAKVKPAKSKG